jgi:ABC-type glutathione transport system ATPase component
MTLHVTILGIDGSGKSTVANALPAVLAAESRVVAGSAGNEFRMATPDEDLLAPGFQCYFRIVPRGRLRGATTPTSS